MTIYNADITLIKLARNIKNTSNQSNLVMTNANLIVHVFAHAL